MKGNLIFGVVFAACCYCFYVAIGTQIDAVTNLLKPSMESMQNTNRRIDTLYKSVMDLNLRNDLFVEKQEEIETGINNILGRLERAGIK